MQKQDTFQYISVLDTLQNLLKTDILQYVLQPHNREDELVEDFCNGQRFKSHPIFSSNPHALQLIGYFDELEVCNPLRTHTKTHKLGIFLFTLGNIPPMQRSTVQTHFLFATATRPNIEKYGLDSILRPFIDELHCLSTTDIDVTIDGVERKFYGGLLAFLGDNLASNSIGGFKESFSTAFRCCRTCLATVVSRKEIFDCSMFQLRTDDAYKQHCNDLNGPIKDHISTTYGIKRRSILIDAPYYSNFNGGLPYDVMHDICEGIAQYHIKLLLKDLIAKKYASLDEFNDRLVHFDYGYSETDRPGPVLLRTLNSPDSKMHLSASQTLLFCRILPLLVGDKVCEDEPSWKCFLLFLDILDIVVSPIISKGLCGHLKLMIKEYLSLFKALYPDSSIIPKMHYYPEQIIAIGPLIRAWTMRCEAKLSLFKRAKKLPFASMQAEVFTIQIKTQHEVGN